MRSCASASLRGGPVYRWLEARTHGIGTRWLAADHVRLDGRHDLQEETLDTWKVIVARGRCESANGRLPPASNRYYGELLDSIYLYNKYGTPISHALWKETRRMLIGSVRIGRPKIMGFGKFARPAALRLFQAHVLGALDRGIRLTEKRSFPATANSG